MAVWWIKKYSQGWIQIKNDKNNLIKLSTFIRAEKFITILLVTRKGIFQEIQTVVNIFYEQNDIKNLVKSIIWSKQKRIKLYGKFKPY